MNPNPYTVSPVAPHPTPYPPPYWLPVLPPNPTPSTSFWKSQNVHDRLTELHDTLSLATAMQKELEILLAMKDTETRSTDPYICGFEVCLKERGIDLETQELVSVDAANALMSKLRALLEPFRCVVDETVPWEEKSPAVRFSEKRLKSKRNKLWRKRKRQRVAQDRAKEHQLFEQADKEADEWRAREVAKDIAQQKVEKMKEIAKLKAKEERKRLESELELVLIVEKLQELRSIRIQKLKKQGHFLPEEDDKFLERVRAAVEEEERQAIAAADTAATKDAIATAVESRKTIQTREPISKELSQTKEINDQSENKVLEDQQIESKEQSGSSTVASLSEEKGSGSHIHSKAYETLANLPIEFYHYYHGSNNDMGTLIEVRRTWDTYIRPGGSRIPGHWVLPPPPADDIWASYLIRPK